MWPGRRGVFETIAKKKKIPKRTVKCVLKISELENGNGSKNWKSEWKRKTLEGLERVCTV